MTLFRRFAPWLAGSIILIQGCAHQPPAHVRYGLKTYPVDSPDIGYSRPSKDRAPLVKLNPDNIQDAEPRPEALAKYGNHTPYDVLGKRYYLRPTAKGYTETGIGSWYGEKFHGQPTSTMEPYDLYAMTAAHKTLPLPTYVRVTNLDNQRSVIVKVNDRGPFVDDRVIDLSYAAAVKLDYANRGTARVKVEAITFEDTPVITRGETRLPGAKPPQSTVALQQSKPLNAVPQTGLLLANNEPTSAGVAVKNKSAGTKITAEANAVTLPPLQLALADKQIFLQAGAFSDQRAAHSLQNQLTQVVDAPVKIAKNDNTHFRVHVGPFANESAAREALTLIRDSQLANPLLIRR